ncbi:LolA family protein [Parvularcula oceani]|uniref:LolA family protein n=1 Tax=Parvularcula oceani TaxID=1247963 RepID=UPI000690B5D2|nr:outer membrane lipoprotein carrier protein LolA [Parvularcula oceani]
MIISPVAPLVMLLLAAAPQAQDTAPAVPAEDAPVDLTAPPAELIEARPVRSAPSEPVPLAAEAEAPAEPRAFPGLSDEAVFQKAAGALEGIDKFQARFVQTAPSGNVSAGTLYLDRPGRLRFEYDEPNPQLIVATGGLVYVHDEELETTDSYPVSQTPLRYLLSKRIDLDGAILSGVQRTADEVAVTLQAADEDLQGEVALVFDAEDMMLRRWAVFDPRGGVTVVALEDVDTEARLPGRLFRAPDAGGTFLRDR